jgi:rhodanese-related sulfurtransferase
VIKLALGIGETLVGKLLLYDALDLSVQKVKLHKNPHCPVCGTDPQITALIDYEEFCGVPARDLGESRVGGGRDIAPAELVERIGREEAITLIDVRDPVEQQVAAIPGAISVPLEKLGRRMADLDRQAEYVLFCRTGVRSARGVRQMLAAGFPHVLNLAGGINAWAEQVDPKMRKY